MYYWSSSEYDATNAWLQNFGGGSEDVIIKSHALDGVRPVRAF
jgi:hypothetical protein